MSKEFLVILDLSLIKVTQRTTPFREAESHALQGYQVFVCMGKYYPFEKIIIKNMEENTEARKCSQIVIS